MPRHPARNFLALLATLLLPLAGCSDDSPEASAPTTNSPSTESTPPPESPKSLDNFDGPITPGSHRVPLIRSDRTYPVDALIEVPEGFITPGGWVVENGQDGPAYGDLMFFGDVELVDTDPCGAGRMVKPGPTVRDLADALAAQRPRTSTEPRPVTTIGGQRGLYVETTVPRDLSRCDGGQFRLWTVDPADSGYYADQPGTVVHAWILDVDGQRVLAAVRVVPGQTIHATELVQMAETARFVKNVHG
jgi:hypothetical protein